jgi:hypothetical protein
VPGALAWSMLRASAMRLVPASFLLLSSLFVAAAAGAQERPIETAAPPATAPTDRPTEMNSAPLLVTGTVLAGAGTISVVSGAILFANDPCSGDDHGPDGSCGMGFGRLMGLVLMGGGGAMALAGAPMIVAGAWQVPADDGGAPEATAALRLGVGHARLDVTF